MKHVEDTGEDMEEQEGEEEEENVLMAAIFEP